MDLYSEEAYDENQGERDLGDTSGSTSGEVKTAQKVEKSESRKEESKKEESKKEESRSGSQSHTDRLHTAQRPELKML